MVRTLMRTHVTIKGHNLAYFFVAIGGALGAMARHGVGQLMVRLGAVSFPYATLFVNVLGSFVIGAIMGLLLRHNPDWSHTARFLLVTGFCGGFTTFSSFSLDVINLYERGDLVLAFLYIALSVMLSIGAVFIAISLFKGANL